MPWKSLERFERTQLNQYDFEAGYDFILQSAFDYYGYEPDYEAHTDKAERLWGIPDPRIGED